MIMESHTLQDKTGNGFSGEVELVVFDVGDYMCALKSDEVREIIRRQSLTNVRLAPSYVLGVINLRGKIVTVIDMRRKLQTGEAAATIRKDERIIIVKSQGDESVGLLVDRVNDILIAKSEEIEQAPKNLGDGLGHYFKGILKMKDSLVAVLDAERILMADD